MNRRRLLKTGGMALVGFGFSGCATGKGARTAPTIRPLMRVNLPPIEASWDRVIRTTVGLRPHRPDGFVLKGEKLDAKTLVHNYGHGGAGHSLGWGTGAIAADIALQQPDRRVAVIGCGTVGLTAARQLQRRGFDVTIYTKAVPPDTTSNMALAQFSPASGLISGCPHAGVGCAIPTGGRDRLSAIATPRRLTLRNLLDPQLQHDRYPADRRTGHAGTERDRSHAARHSTTGARPGRARSGRAPVSDEIRAQTVADAD